MTAQDAINGLLVVAGIVIFVARGIKKLRAKTAAVERAEVPQGTAAPQRTPAPQRTAAPQRMPAPQLPPARQRPVPSQRPGTAAQAATRTPAIDFAAGAPAAFQILELTLPDAGFGDPGAARAPRRTAKRVWGANAIIAMEVLGPPVSLRSGATLGAPHAF